jgi:hypothetical protein
MKRRRTISLAIGMLEFIIEFLHQLDQEGCPSCGEVHVKLPCSNCGWDKTRSYDDFHNIFGQEEATDDKK